MVRSIATPVLTLSELQNDFNLLVTFATKWMKAE